MADFRTHVTTSSVLGVVYGVSGHVHWNIAPSSCVVAAGLCGVAGMLPDVDSDTGHTQRELMSFLAAVAPMLMLERFSQLHFSNEQIVLAAGSVYVLVRFGLGEILRRYTVHRGMWHSLPAAIIAGLVASLLCAGETPLVQWFKVGAVALGYCIHLLLDELWAIEWRRGRLRFKNSFGTAFKLFSRSLWANISTYAKLILLAGLVYGDPMIMRYLEKQQHLWHYVEQARSPFEPQDNVARPAETDGKIRSE